MSGTNGGIPPNLDWDENNPPIKNLCCGLVDIHDPSCDGYCDKKPCTELETELMNENREWARIGMKIGSVGHSAWKMQNQIDAIISYLRSEDVDAEEALDIHYQTNTINRMRTIREAYKDQVMRSNLGLPAKPNILGPDGKPLG